MAPVSNLRVFLCFCSGLCGWLPLNLSKHESAMFFLCTPCEGVNQLESTLIARLNPNLVEYKTLLAHCGRYQIGQLTIDNRQSPKFITLFTTRCNLGLAQICSIIN